MNYNLSEAINILERTPQLLSVYLKDLPENWVMNNEGENTWSPFDVMGHLVHGEKTDWMARINIILSNQENKTFEPFDRFAQHEDSKGKTINHLLDEFKVLRTQNLATLKSLNIQPTDYQKEGIHPALGTVTLEQLLSVWVAHDLGHIAQISRVMAKQYKNNVGPWKAYLRVVND
ncbi:MAG: DinB family protein [Flavobacteriales bacterium]